MSAILMTRRASLLLASIALAAFALTAPVSAFEKVYTDDGIAIEGYDPVAYFTDRQPVEGSDEFETEYQGTTWRFASAANRDAFVADPAKYAPQYGGYCAYAVSEGYTASIDPDAWTIDEGRLYLNYSLGIRDRWDRNRAERIVQGDENWPRIVAAEGPIR